MPNRSVLRKTKNVETSYFCCYGYRWMDGAFLDLEAEAIEGEVDEYWREIYKIQKVFNQKVDILVLIYQLSDLLTFEFVKWLFRL